MQSYLLRHPEKENKVANHTYSQLLSNWLYEAPLLHGLGGILKLLKYGVCFLQSPKLVNSVTDSCVCGDNDDDDA